MKLVKKAASKVKWLAQNYYHMLKSRAGHVYYARKMEKLLNSAAGPATPPNRLFAGISDNFWLWSHTVGLRRSPRLREILPGMAEEQFQFNVAATTGETTLIQAFLLYRLFKGIYEKHVGPISGCPKVLDFGCGWGRVLRYFLRDQEPAKLWGLDCNPALIETCQRINKWCHFELGGVHPPTAIAAGSFDLIYSFSVFSHFSEEMHKEWLGELHRIMRPGGLLIATTRGREFIQLCAQLRQRKKLPSHMLNGQPLSSLFPNTEQSLADFDNGEFCYGARHYDWWGEACISKKYVLEHWTDFDFVDYIDDRRQCEQNVIVVRKKGPGR